MIEICIFQRGTVYRIIKEFKHENVANKSTTYQELFKEYFKRGNCWDNTTSESFFGHTKEEIYLIDSKTLEDVEKSIDEYMGYNNNYRHQ